MRLNRWFLFAWVCRWTFTSLAVFFLAFDEIAQLRGRVYDTGFGADQIFGTIFFSFMAIWSWLTQIEWKD